jgi:Flp pilus assembly pilin Flp
MLKQFLREEEGQSTVEYLLILAVIVTAVTLLGRGLQKQIPALVDNVFKGINNKVGTLMGGANP